ncbi:MAG: response regulator [Opitutae bacterium]
MKILIVEDEPVSREVLRKILSSREDCQISIAQNGDEAWALLDDPNRAFDVVFLDITMPEPDGLEVLRRIRQSPLLQSVYVVMCTATSDRATVTKVIQLGAQSYVVKPCNEAGVLAKLTQAQSVSPARKIARISVSSS